jgi:YidC/Oxa1 family membrane protein insertase
MQELRETHKKDPQKLNQEMMKLYKEHGVNPVGGCFPMLLQMPVFIALFQVLSRTIELRRAPFMLWIQDLSSPDVIARLPFSLPFIGDSLSLLPILMGVAMFVQQKMQTTDPKQAAMTYMLPVVFTVLFFRFPSGLVLYWLVNNILTIGHQYLMVRSDRLKEVPATGGL